MCAGRLRKRVSPQHSHAHGIVYIDDLQVSDSIARRRDLFGQFTIYNLTPVLAAGLDNGREFLYVAVAPAPQLGELQ